MRVPTVKEVLTHPYRRDPVRIPERPVVPPNRLPDRFIPSPDLGPEPEFSVPRLPIDLGEDWPRGIPRWPTTF